MLMLKFRPIYLLLSLKTDYNHCIAIYKLYTKQPFMYKIMYKLALIIYKMTELAAINKDKETSKIVMNTVHD